MHEDGKKSTRYPLASVMIEMKSLAKVNPSDEVNHAREACDRAFALACQYSGGHELVEEMVATRFWPLRKSKHSFRIEMVNLPIFCEAKGVPFPYFGITLSGETPKDFGTTVEEGARKIVGDITDKEFLARRSNAGSMPRLNRVFEELGIHHVEHKVLAKVLKSLEEKAKKATTKNATMATESKKRRGCWWSLSIDLYRQHKPKKEENIHLYTHIHVQLTISMYTSRIITIAETRAKNN
jgi:hypothetical protein